MGLKRSIGVSQHIRSLEWRIHFVISKRNYRDFLCYRRVGLLQFQEQFEALYRIIGIIAYQREIISGADTMIFGKTCDPMLKGIIERVFIADTVFAGSPLNSCTEIALHEAPRAESQIH
jgi:hypothetical protein